MDRKSRIARRTRLPALVCLAAGVAVFCFSGRGQQRGPTRSPHGSLSIPCASCHTDTSWSPLRAIPEFNHNGETRYPLRGMHENVACKLCHTRLVFTDVGKKCADCHADIHRRQFGARCEECHTVKGWNVGVQSVREHSARFPLIGGHAAADCESCHRGAAVAQYTGLSADCYSCHQTQFNTAAVVDHRAAGFPTDCRSCHTFDGWRAVNFDHARFTGFALIGPHAKLDCATCHIGNRFKGTPADCFSCHVKDYNGASNPNHVAAAFPKDCAVCHTASSWAGARFDHTAMTKFALTGAHANLSCSACHVGGRFAGTPADCYSCHTATFNSTNNPDHRKAGIPTDCSQCHNTINWQNAKFDHSLVKFPLTGAHATLQCAQCHLGNSFTTASTQCASCHLKDFQKTTSPNHVTAAFPQDCSVCHNTTSWQNAKFDHSITKFPLTGAHTAVQCAVCHPGNNFTTASPQCVSCHLADFQKTTDPNHVAAGFPQDCSVCHNTTNWQNAKFDHSGTKFPLTGAHATVQCAQCHVGNKFAGTPTSCASCHLTDFQKTTDPNHATAGFPQDCSLCHSTTSWAGAKFDHSAATKFPLTGAHVQVPCLQCHVGNKFAGTPTDCVGCHLGDFTKTTSPSHTAAGFPQTCGLCHNTAAWRPASFDHAKTGFPLTGVHVQTPCAQCHANNRFAGTPTQCSACHLDAYNKTTNPNHAAAGFPQDCSICHSTATWQGASFNHATTKFPLTGAHSSLQCALCHKNNQFVGLPTTCVSCHLANYNSTTNPNHAAAGFPQQCEVCHNTTAWTPASFDHNATKFPLTGAHTSVQCSQCHINGVFAGTPTDCYSCHKAQYQSVANPNHVAAGFPTTCADCHTTATWTGAVFNHTWFPIFSGSHAGRWTTCGDCHTNPSNYAAFSCINCHAHDKTTTDSHHTDVSNYVYASANCYACHPTGRGGN